MNNDGVKLSCAKNGTVMKLVLTSLDKEALEQRHWSLYNNNATGSKELEWINDNDDSQPYSAFVWTNRKRLRAGLRNALDLKHGAAEYDSPEDEEEMDKFLDQKTDEWISNIEKEDYIRFTAKVERYAMPEKKGCTIDRILAQEHGYVS
tara:strand:- start:1012 stop:1458 length:447 start_codon:yes stop_codon:yes gene_type:complete